MAVIHRQVAAARVALGVSQRQLALMAGITRTQLMRLETGGNVTLETLQRVLVQLPELRFQLVSMTVVSAADAVIAAAENLKAILDTPPPPVPSRQPRGGGAELFDGDGGLEPELRARIAELDRLIDEKSEENEESE